MDIKNLNQTQIDKIVNDLKKLDFDSRVSELYKIIDLIGYDVCNDGTPEFENIILIFDNFEKELDLIVDRIMKRKN